MFKPPTMHRRIACLLAVSFSDQRIVAAVKFGSWWSSGTSEGSAVPSQAVQAPMDEAWEDEALPMSAPEVERHPMQAPNSHAASSQHSEPGQGYEWSWDRKQKAPVAAFTQISKPSQPTVSMFDELPQASAESSRSGEGLTMEDRARLKTGDVEEVRGTTIPEVNHLKRKTHTLSLAAKEVHQEENPFSSKPDAQEQCLKFATWAKGLNIYGNEVVKVFKRTCAPAVEAGVATESYAQMCAELEPKVAELTKHKDWSPGVACQLLLDHFQASGIGASPFLG